MSFSFVNQDYSVVLLTPWCTSTADFWRGVSKYLLCVGAALDGDAVQTLKWCVHPLHIQNPLCFDHGCHLQTCLATLANRSTKLGVNRRGQISAAFSGPKWEAGRGNRPWLETRELKVSWSGHFGFCCDTVDRQWALWSALATEIRNYKANSVS